MRGSLPAYALNELHQLHHSHELDKVFLRLNSKCVDERVARLWQLAGYGAEHFAFNLEGRCEQRRIFTARVTKHVNRQAGVSKSRLCVLELHLKFCNGHCDFAFEAAFLLSDARRFGRVECSHQLRTSVGNLIGWCEICD